MATRHGTANMLAQNRAYRELESEYSPEVARCLTARNLLRNGVDVRDADVAAWAKINDFCCKARLDIRDEVRRAERTASVAAGTAVRSFNSRIKS
jgi:hypothetical protein